MNQIDEPYYAIYGIAIPGQDEVRPTTEDNFLHVGIDLIEYTPDAHGRMCCVFSFKKKRVIKTATIN
jgi:hypothetical protein